MERVNTRLQVLLPGETTARLDDVLNYALNGVPQQRLRDISAIRPGPVLFAAAIDGSGIHMPLYSAMRNLRLSGDALADCAVGAIIDGETELYTKSVGRELLFSANACGAALPGKPLVEGTGSLYNYTVLAQRGKCSNMQAYQISAQELVQRLLAYEKPAHSRPKLLVLYAGKRETSNTLTLWEYVRAHIEGCIDIKEIALRNGAVTDCEGCAYTTCLHLGERGNCFYGGVMVEEVYPALLNSDALMLLCPNYNDAVDANMTAFINRLTALFRANTFYQKALFAIIVSGYSGGELLAQQLVSALCINKTFQLPPRFCMLETANAPGSIRQVAGISEHAKAFARAMKAYLQVNH